MRLFPMHALRWRVALVAAVITLGCGLMAFAGLPETRAERRIAARSVWGALPHDSYRIVIQAALTGRTCMQEIEVHTMTLNILRDTCGSPWLSTLTVDRLFELSSRLEAAPDCFPSKQNCMCHRVRTGIVQYDPEMGFPTMISWRRELRPNWQHPDYWLRAWEARALPNCSIPARTLKLDVVSLTPLE